MARHLLSLRDIPPNEFGALLTRFAGVSGQGSDRWLTGRVIGLLFDRPSTRTRLSFCRASSTLGGLPIELRKTDLQLVTGEDPTDTARVLPLYLDALVARTRTVADLEIYASQTQMSVVNALTDEEHPTQAIADMLTILQAFGRFEGVRVLFVGEGGNIAISFLYAAAMLPDISVTFLTPRKYRLPTEAITKANRIGNTVHRRIVEIHDPSAPPSGIDVVYTTRWRSMGEEKQDALWRSHFQGFQVTAEFLSKVGTDHMPFVMHDLPAEKGSEIVASLMEGERSLIWRQAANKVLAAAAALYWCLNTHL